MRSLVQQRWFIWTLLACACALLNFILFAHHIAGMERNSHRAEDGSKPPRTSDLPDKATGKRLTAMAEHLARFDERLERWSEAFESRAPDLDFKWHPGATDNEIARLEDWAGQVPADLKRLLMAHNGQPEEATPFFWVNRLLSCDEIIFESTELHEINVDIDPTTASRDIPMKDAVWWHADLMLFLSDGSGGGVAIDRRTGAIWDWDHDGGMFGMMAPDLGTFLEWIAIAFEEGRFTHEDAGDILLLPDLSEEKAALNPSSEEEQPAD